MLRVLCKHLGKKQLENLQWIAVCNANITHCRAARRVESTSAPNCVTTRDAPCMDNRRGVTEPWGVHQAFPACPLWNKKVDAHRCFLRFSLSCSDLRTGCSWRDSGEWKNWSPSADVINVRYTQALPPLSTEENLIESHTHFKESHFLLYIKIMVHWYRITKQFPWLDPWHNH